MWNHFHYVLVFRETINVSFLEIIKDQNSSDDGLLNSGQTPTPQKSVIVNYLVLFTVLQHEMKCHCLLILFWHQLTIIHMNINGSKSLFLKIYFDKC